MKFRRLLALPVACLFVCIATTKAIAADAPVDGLSLGKLTVERPRGEAKGLVFLFSDLSGWNDELDDAAARLVDLGMIVAPVDLRSFLERQDALGRDCLYL